MEAAQVDRLRIAANEQIKNFDLPRVVELAVKATGLRAGEAAKQSIVAYLANGADGAGLTRWGLANAINSVGRDGDVTTYDDGIDFERASARIIDLKPDQWSVISAAPAA